MIRLIFAFLLPALFAGNAWASQPNDWTRVRIGIVDHYAPFSFINHRGQPEGFDIDIASALCRQMEAECQFIKREWTDLIPALLARQFDAIIASMSITEERRRLIDFSQHYYRTSAAFVVTRASNIRDTSPQAMKGRIIGVVTDTVQASYAKRVYEPEGVSLKFYSSVAEEQYDLVRGRVDAIFADKIALHEWLEKSPQGRCCIFAGEIRDRAIIGEGIGVGLRKEDQDLKAKFNAALETILANGIYQKINDKYFPFSVY